MSREQPSLIPAPLDLIEEAIRLLRAHPVTLLTYLGGSLPFAVALLYFWADMSRGAFAGDRCALGALGLGMLFLAMKTAHGVFCAQLLSRIAHTPPQAWTAGRILRLASVQAVLQPFGLVLLPAPFSAIAAPALASEERVLAVLLVLGGALISVGMGWTYAFFQAATVAADRSEGVARHAFRDAWRQCVLWPVQNHSILALVGLVGMVVFLNTVVGLVTLPALLKMLLGIESDFTLTQWSIFNTTFFFAAAILAWLVLDPVVKAVYVLRSFRGESVRSGADLRAQLRSFQGRAATLVAVLLLGFALCPQARAAEPEPAPAGARPTDTAAAPASGAAVDPLGQAMDDVLARRVYTWREPRERQQREENKDDWLSRTLKALEQSLQNALRTVARALYAFIDWILLRRLKFPKGGNNGGLFDWTAGLDIVLYALLGVGILLIAWQAWRVWRRREAQPVLETVAIPVAPDLRDENVSAEQLPEDGWLGMARDLAGRGELRLALRALYLAGLAGLARRGLVTLARHKSNRDYVREVDRRARAMPQVPATFASMVATFDRAWYGTHDVSAETLSEFEGGVKQLLVTPP